MKSLSTLPIKWKLVVMIMAVSLLGLLISGAAFVVLNKQAVDRAMTEELRVLAKVIGDRSTAALAFDDQRLGQENLAALSAESAILSACLYGSDQRTFAHYYRDAQNAPRCNTLSTVAGVHHTDVSIEVVLPIEVEGTPVGRIAIYSGLQKLHGQFLNLLIAAAIIILLTVVAAFPLSFLLQRLISEPASQLVDTASRIAKDQDYSLRVPQRSEDEFGRLAEAFNSMVATIETQDRSLRLDLTERQRNERELRHLRNMLSNIIDSMPSMLVGVDLEGRVTQWNHKAAVLTGRPAEQVLGFPLKEAFPEMMGEWDKIKRAMAENEIQKDAKVACLLGKAQRFSDIVIFPLVGSRVQGAVIRVDDVTDRVQIEEMMIQSEKMLSVGGLAAGMAHEINNPLAGILQNIQVMELRLNPDSPRNQKVAAQCGLEMDPLDHYLKERGVPEMMASVLESGKRAARIVENMLSFSRKSESSFYPHNLAELMDQTIELAANDYDLKKKYDFRKIEMVRHYADDLPEVPCDGTKIQQVVLNLLKNGAQAMAMAGTTQAPCFTLRLYTENQSVCIEVEDNGPGMEESVRSRVFEPFYTTKEVGVGTGLGLSVSYFIITENHGGSMSVESVKGQGSCFIVRLPLPEPVGEGDG
ncbi:ATP-binding protein [Magnetococcus sp. PR-3]|uniref:ATP-binding protein n=1 Tax=Magnetococcus sp. PR-3 TaxID=3120355 RepID=UPI002FCE40AD